MLVRCISAIYAVYDLSKDFLSLHMCCSRWVLKLVITDVCWRSFLCNKCTTHVCASLWSHLHTDNITGSTVVHDLLTMLKSCWHDVPITILKNKQTSETLYFLSCFVTDSYWDVRYEFSIQLKWKWISVTYVELTSSTKIQPSLSYSWKIKRKYDENEHICASGQWMRQSAHKFKEAISSLLNRWC